MRTSKLLSVLALACALTVPAMAIQGNGKAKGKNKEKDKHSQVDRERNRWDDDESGGMRFQGMDRNGDGRISRNEWRGNDQSFANHDWNGDGILSGEEVRPGAKGEDDRWNDDDWNDQRNWGERFADLDRNDDGYLSRNEWPGGDRAFSRLDLNHDGRVSFREVQEHYRQRR